MTTASAPEQNAIILCSTARLARGLQLAHAQARRESGAAQWRPPVVLTLAQWLESTVESAMLCGQLPEDYLPAHALDPVGERLLWESVIEKSTRDDAAQALFDMPGLAGTAAEAHRLLVEWGVQIDAEEQTEETRRFLAWREQFDHACRQHGTLDGARLQLRQVQALERSAGRLPAAIQLAGFDRMSPLERRLIDALAARGVHVATLPLGLAAPAPASQIACDDAEAECRAAVAWAAHRLADQPMSRIAIVAPELGALRNRLAALLDDVLHPAALHPARAESPRLYDFSLGAPLASQPLVACALDLLRIATHPYRVPQQDAGRLLRDVFWSQGLREADARARLEARMRGRLSLRITLDQWLRLARKAQLDGLALAGLIAHLEAFSAAVTAWPRRQGARAWGAAFAALLEAAGWPGERSLSSHEYQARQAWDRVLADFSNLDGLLGALDAAAALRRLAQLAQERIFQPEAEGESRLLVMGMLEASAMPLDALWVMGMNDHLWPPAPGPNPLLPAEAQRRSNAPNACSRVQAEFAKTVHARLMHAAREVVFSWAHREGERELRPSPLLDGVPSMAVAEDAAETLAERLAIPAVLESLDDHRAPPVAPGELQRGGTGLLKAQALCPAWAYYQYRLGARALDEPSEGLDAIGRGNLLHLVLQAFWQGRGHDWLHGLDEAGLGAAVEQAVEDGLAAFAEQSDEHLPEQFALLERLRLRRLLTAWIAVEMERPPFTVLECERRIEQEIGGLRVTLVLDRVDALPDGQLVVLDYKTGAGVSHRSWADRRIAEPQLPIYAALALRGEAVAAVCFAKVHASEQKFIGIAAQEDVLPGVTSLDGARRWFPEADFPDWPALLAHWEISLAALAEEILAGEAAVNFRSEDDLRDCEVKPLLRLPERKLQRESAASA